MPDDRRAGEIEIADRVEQLVAHELVGVAQAAAVQHPVAADHDGVVERAAARQPGRAQALDIVEQAEGAGPAELGFERVRRRTSCCMSWRRISGLGEIDLEAHREAVDRAERRRCAAGSPTCDRLQHLDRAPRRVLLDDAGAFDQKDERRGAAVHDRHFGPVELDDRIVDARSPASAAIRCSTVPTSMPSPFDSIVHSAEFDGIVPVARGSRRRRRCARKTIPVPGAAGMQGHRDALPRMKADAAATDRRSSASAAGQCPDFPQHPTDSLMLDPDEKPSGSPCTATNHSLLQIVARRSASIYIISIRSYGIADAPGAPRRRREPRLDAARDDRLAGQFAWRRRKAGMSRRSSSLRARPIRRGSSAPSRGCAGLDRRGGIGWRAVRLRLRRRAARGRRRSRARSGSAPGPCGLRGRSRVGGGAGTAGWASGIGRAGPASTGFGAIKAPPRTAALSAASAAGGTRLAGALGARRRRGRHRRRGGILRQHRLGVAGAGRLAQRRCRGTGRGC